MRLRYSLFILLTSSFLSACTTTAPTNTGAASQASDSQTKEPLPEIIVIEKEVPATKSTGVDFAPYTHAKTAELLSYIDAFSQADAKWQKAELNALTSSIEKAPENWRLQIKQAAILAMPNSAVLNYSEAKKILSSLLANDALSSSDQHLVKLIAAFSNHQEQLSAKIVDSSKKQQALTKKNKALQQKLDDIKNIEKTMIERNAKSSAK